ncbi:MAG: prolyl oligopeptidase family serine peptidase [bacterium]|nr:prolyl oligopeptidase family serine peptidase [bacterium]
MSEIVRLCQGLECVVFVAAAILGLMACASPAGAEDLSVLPDELDGVPPNQMMHEHLMARAHAAIDAKLEAYESLMTPEQIVDYQKRMRTFFMDRIGGFPERTPLNARIVDTEQRDGYRVEKVILESQPGLYVTALMYLPEAEPPYPAVLVPCGHSTTGKARDLYQRAPILIAKNGMAALCYDPIDQGERVQLIDDKGKVQAVGVSAHQLMGVGNILVGRNVAMFRIWDGMRCIDYLQSRDDVDPERIGCTGISGGGTLTSYLMALDDRISAAAPGCYITSLRRHIETTGPQDAEQNIQGQIAFGMGHEDYVMMRAPRPTLIMTATDDYFDIAGAWDSFRMAKRLYEKLGHAERVDIFETTGDHGFPKPMREAACRWMRRWLLRVDDAIVEEEFPIAEEKDTWCAPRGRTLLLPGCRTTYDINAAYAEELAETRKAIWDRADKTEGLSKVRAVTGIRWLDEFPAVPWEKTGSVQRDGYRIDKLVIKPDPTIWLPALAFVPPEPKGPACLYVHADGKESDSDKGGPIEQRVVAGQLVLSVDLRGLGETLPTAKAAYGGRLSGDWQDVYLAYVLDSSYLAMRAEDVLACARFLSEYPEAGASGPVELVSVGRTGPPALHAAALESGLFASVTLRESLTSWMDVMHTPRARRQLMNTVHGALLVYDLPDLVASLPPDKITVTESLDATEQPAP